MINCPYWSKRGMDGGECSLGMYGGRPSLGVCAKCVSMGQNTVDHAKEMEAIYEKAWPSKAPRVSGCCDRADQA